MLLAGPPLLEALLSAYQKMRRFPILNCCSHDPSFDLEPMLKAVIEAAKDHTFIREVGIRLGEQHKDDGTFLAFRFLAFRLRLFLTELEHLTGCRPDAVVHEF